MFYEGMKFHCHFVVANVLDVASLCSDVMFVQVTELHNGSFALGREPKATQLYNHGRAVSRRDLAAER